MELSLAGVLEARTRIRPYLKPTPLVEYPFLSQLLSCQAWVKHEASNPTGAFKIRGGINLVSALRSEGATQGLVTATRGNHGQSIALASRLFGLRCVVVVPEGNNPEKNQAIRNYGAELVVYGRDFDEAREKVEELQQKEGLRYVHSGNEPHLIHGVATYALEIFEELPRVDVIIVPIGGGSGASGTLTVARALKAKVEVIGVQAERASAVYQSWKEGRIIQTDSADTIADGLATRVPFELPLSVMRQHIDEIVTVTEEEIRSAVYRFFRTTHHVAEPAAAASLAAAYRMRDRLNGRSVALVHSGCNIELPVFRSILQEFESES